MRGFVCLAIASISFGLGACSLQVEYENTRFSCDAVRPSCPGEEICVDGLCEKPGVLGDGEDATVDTPSSLDGGVALDAGARGDADVSLDAGGAVDGGEATLRLGERPTSDVKSVTSDAFLDALLREQNFGGDDRIDVDAIPTRHGLLRFELGAFPGGVQVRSATLRLVVDRALDDGELVLAPLLESWVAEEVTWEDRSTGVAWSEAGGGAGEVVASTTAREPGEVLLVLPAALVQSWIDSPGDNNGLRLRSTSQEGQGAKLISSDSGRAADRPELELVLTLP